MLKIKLPLLALILAIVFSSCEKETGVENLSEQLFKIEQNVDTNNMHFSYQTDPFDDFHAMFFEKLKEIKDPNDTAELDELINNFELKSGEISTKDSLSEQEQMIIESFFNSIHPYEEIDFNVEVCDFILVS